MQSRSVEGKTIKKVHRGAIEFTDGSFMPSHDSALTLKETAARLRVSRDTLYRLLKSPTFTLKPVQVGRTMRFSERAVEAFLAGEPAERKGSFGIGSRRR
jgi:excisionase family DNA binding protein